MKTDLFLNYLREEGYCPRLDEDGDVVFKYEGNSYIIFADEQDPSYFRLAMPFFWRLDDERERGRAVAAADQVNAHVKVVKIFLIENFVWGAVELFLDPLDSFRNVLPRCLRALARGVDKFCNIMNTEA